ncbi:uncharacterized protein LOC115686025 [Syzygium oleosum]|uniref:uncharacterized protein LOC115686025 n=1 Tax=Syzygium oleosum TaxID=219896 RepID=UPI0011D1A99F|nr:uncharacterized protein LOC115686025 [Syzygium oleosum]
MEEESWTMFFDGAVNLSGSGTRAILISPNGQHYHVATKLVFPYTNNIAEYEACILGLQGAIEMKVNKPKVFGNSALIILQTVGNWRTRDAKLVPYHEYLEDLVKEFDKISFEYLSRSHNQFADALATLSSMLQATNSLEVKPLKIEILSRPAHCMMVAKEFEKNREAASYATVTTRNVVKFMRRDIIACYGVPEAIITDNGSNLNNGLVNDLFKEFQIRHLNSSPYRPKMNGAVEVANKNIKKILAKAADNYHNWHERLPYALMVYRTSIRTSTGATPFSLVYGVEAILPVEVKVPSLRVLSQAKLMEAEWVQQRYNQLNMIDEKWLRAVCHGQRYQQRVAKSFNRKIRPRHFEVNDLILRKILSVIPHPYGKFGPNYSGPYVVKKVLPGGALILAEMDG